MNLRLALVALTALPLLTLSSLALADEPSAAPGAAHAEGGEGEGRLPLAVAERPLTLPRFVLSPEVVFAVPRFQLGSGLASSSSTFTNLSVGASFGITDDLTVRATVLPLQLTGPSGTGFHYGQLSGIYLGFGDPGPGIGATYRVLKGGIELGVSLDANLITAQQFSGVVITPGVPVRFHINKQLRLDTGAYLAIQSASLDVGGGQSVSFSSNGFTIPVSALYDIIEPLHVGVSTGFGILDFNHVSDSTQIPLGVFAGYAIKGPSGPILDIDPFFSFPAFVTPGGASATQTGDYVVGVNVGGFFYL